MAASLQAAATLMQPAKMGRSASSSSAVLLPSSARPSSHAARTISCSLTSDLREVATKCADAAKLAGFALATSALLVSVNLTAHGCFHHFIFYASGR